MTSEVGFDAIRHDFIEDSFREPSPSWVLRFPDISTFHSLHCVELIGISAPS